MAVSRARARSSNGEHRCLKTIYPSAYYFASKSYDSIILFTKYRCLVVCGVWCVAKSLSHSHGCVFFLVCAAARPLMRGSLDDGRYKQCWLIHKYAIGLLVGGVTVQCNLQRAVRSPATENYYNLPFGWVPNTISLNMEIVNIWVSISGSTITDGRILPLTITLHADTEQCDWQFWNHIPGRQSNQFIFLIFFVSMSNSEWWWWYFGLLRCFDLLSHSQFDKNSINISCTFCCCSSVMSTRSMYRVAQRQNQAIALSAHVNCKKVRRCRKENSLAFQPKANILYSQMHRGIHCADRSFRVILQVFVRQMKISNVVRLTAKLRNR